MPAGRPSEYNKMIIETKKIADLKPAPYNPRQSTEKQEEKLKASLSKFGLVEPIIFNKQTGYIVGGHFRVRELTKLGYEEIECVIVDLNEADEKELNIRLNANTGQWDWDALANEWNSDELTEWGLDVPNFAPDVDYSILDEEDVSDQLESMADGVKKAIQIEFEPDHYEEAYELVKFWRERDAYVGKMILDFLKAEKELL
jgi:ParB-like chromosome segregation protein Spo0J